MRKTFTSITVNGQTYGSVGEMPPEVRAKYERLMGHLHADRDGNGVPDVFEAGTVDGAEVVHLTTTHSEVYDVDGHGYASLDEMPPEVRRLVMRVGRAGGGSVTTRNPAGAEVVGGLRGGPDHRGARSGFHIRLSWRALAWLAGGLILAALWLVWALGTE